MNEEKISLSETPKIFAIDKRSTYKLWNVGMIEYPNGVKDVLVQATYDEDWEFKLPVIKNKKDYTAFQVFLKFSYIEWEILDPNYPDHIDCNESNEGFQIVNGVKNDIYFHWEVMLEDYPELIDEIMELPAEIAGARIREEVDKMISEMRSRQRD
jgi:hypothetical protein